MSTYNGYKNYETWNVSLWINNNQGLYEAAKVFDSYEGLVDDLNSIGVKQTPDKVSFEDPALDIKALNELVAEIKENK